MLAAATRLFAARGFDATSVQDIADEVGLSKQAVLHHFASKDALRRAVLDEILAHWRDTLPRLLLEASAHEDRFESVFSALHRFWSESPDRARVIAREGLDRPDEVRRLLRGPMKPWLASVAEYVQRARPGLDAEAYVAHVLQMIILGAAGASVSSAAIPGAERERRARWDAELRRLARVGLFGGDE
jgi:AcrR family transcriptional regulator